MVLSLIVSEIQLTLLLCAISNCPSKKRFQKGPEKSLLKKVEKQIKELLF